MQRTSGPWASIVSGRHNVVRTLSSVSFPPVPINTGPTTVFGTSPFADAASASLLTWAWGLGSFSRSSDDRIESIGQDPGSTGDTRYAPLARPAALQVVLAADGSPVSLESGAFSVNSLGALDIYSSGQISFPFAPQGGRSPHRPTMPFGSVYPTCSSRRGTTSRGTCHELKC